MQGAPLKFRTSVRIRRIHLQQNLQSGREANHVSLYSGERIVLSSSFKLESTWRGPKLLTPMKFKSCSMSYIKG